ncbi:methyl-accepting chemotaxis protein [Brevibacillus invocatus]|uniref:methyl-accepting chemotaxis protein n=1 Tax=Brevibacillus invocatus TaxID=173959 RepID=UPI00203C174A|nr:methyl-accepting chemotaxis protein [Brevibacillus invocatus]MCM3079484.1 methyl-accepting chemotaxis protein [Brevibacillus invocatus]MCM3429464.1 methyl-accepting chemotaxis protein [Brevibacillus invocatus]
MRKAIKSIRAKLVIWFMLIALLPLLALSTINYNQTSNELIQKQKDSFQSIVETKTQAMDQWLNYRKSEVELAAKTPTVQSLQAMSITPYLKVIQDQSNVYESVAVIGEDGLILADSTNTMVGLNLKDRQYFQKGMKGESSFSEILTSKGTGNRILNITSPIHSTDGKVVGVLAASINFESFIRTFMENENQNLFILLVDEVDRLQYSTLPELMGKTIDEAQLGEAYSTIVKDAKNTVGTQINGNSGMEYLISYAPITETGYSLIYNIPLDIVLASANAMQTNMILVMTVAAVLVIILAIIISGTISKPITKVIEQVKQIANGDLTNSVTVKGNDEIAQLGRHVQDMTDQLRELIGKVAQTSEQVAASAEELTASAEEASRATEQISSSAQQIAAGADQQVTNTDVSQKVVRKMSSEISQISLLSQNLTTLSDEAVETSANGNQVVVQSMEQMKHIEETTNRIAQTVNELGNKSTEIEEIISVITGIANQTNLLALNAAIEAARAGEHGRGFAVVADEVRKLAEQSGHAAEQISSIIQQIQQDIRISMTEMTEGLAAVQAGTHLTEQAGDSFSAISRSVSDVYSQIQKVTAAIKELQAGSDQMVTSIESVQSISQDFAGTTQEVAAASEEQNASMEEISATSMTLARMAEDLQESVNSFKL